MAFKKVLIAKKRDEKVVEHLIKDILLFLGYNLDLNFDFVDLVEKPLVENLTKA